MGKPMSEAALQRHFIAEAKRLGIFACKVVSMGVRGFPDLVVIVGGKVTFIELKKQGGVLSDLQRFMHYMIRAAGGTVEVLAGRESVDKWLKECRD
jgi:hypothetical protein